MTETIDFAPAITPRPGATFRLMVMRGDAVTFHPLPQRGEVTVGRAPDAGVCVPDATLSRVHLRFSLGDCITVTDMGSRNGTRVRGERVEADTVTEIAIGNELRPGDLVEAGAVLFAVQLVRAPSSKPAAMPEARPQQVVSRSAEPEVRDGNAPVVLDPAMVRLHQLLTRIAAGNIPVLLLGETGAGKEIAAEHIHRSSPRASKSFLRLNCASLADTLLESELFGHEKGAFTGAVEAKKGLLENADGGTVFLDEVGEIPLSTQVKLLRVLEERKVTRVGALQPRDIDVRVVAATNRNLEAEISRGTFRQDLYFRLSGIAVEIPPLRERVVEILPLARNFLRREAERNKAPAPDISPAAAVALEAHAWPGNVRELRNVMARAALLAGAGPIGVEHLAIGTSVFRVSAPESAAQPAAPSVRPPPVTPSPAPAGGASLKEEFSAMEKQRILDALAQCVGNQTRAAKTLGMPRRTFIARLETYGIARPRKGTSDPDE